MGVTEAERSLQRLCEGTFLSLWSYAGVHRQLGDEKKHGKEVADLLVVFGDDVIVFSDKSCAFPDTGDVKLDWSRWFRRAVQGAADQAWGAERWIRKHPGTLYLDAKCTEPFPIAFPALDRVRFHHVVVAHNAAERCQSYFGEGSGSLALTNALLGADHVDPERVEPFVVGDLDPTRGFVHVLDDTTLDILLGTLDTVADLTAYLVKKEALFRSATRVFTYGEEELLAHYLRDVDNETGEHAFRVPLGVSEMVFREGEWDRFSTSAERLSQVRADKVSYAWDKLIETFSGHVLAGTTHHATDPAPEALEPALRLLAAEPRFRRRQLAGALLEYGRGVPPHQRNTWKGRLALASEREGAYYIFVVVPPFEPPVSDEEYRRRRREILIHYCKATKDFKPDAQHMVALGFTSVGAGEGNHSEEVVYLDGRDWTPEMIAEAAELRSTLGIWQSPIERRVHDQEYPAGRTWSPRSDGSL